MPQSIEELFSNKGVELFDLENDPYEINNPAMNRRVNGELLIAMNNKLNALIKSEVGEDNGQMLPGGQDANWKPDPGISKLRM